MYNNDTDCETEILRDVVQLNSFGRTVPGNRTVSTRNFQSSALPYHVCSETTWQQEGEEMGPVHTFVWFYNPCEERQLFFIDVIKLNDTGALSPLECDVPF